MGTTLECLKISIIREESLKTVKPDELSPEARQLLVTDPLWFLPKGLADYYGGGPNAREVTRRVLTRFFGPRMVEILCQRYAEGQQFTVIGDNFGISGQSVNARLKSAEDRLRQGLHIGLGGCLERCYAGRIHRCPDRCGVLVADGKTDGENVKPAMQYLQRELKLGLDYLVKQSAGRDLKKPWALYRASVDFRCYSKGMWDVIKVGAVEDPEDVVLMASDPFMKEGVWCLDLVKRQQEIKKQLEQACSQILGD